VRRLAGAAAALLATVTAAGCLGGDERGGSAREGGTIRIGISPALRSLDPAVASNAAEREAVWLVYTPPVTYARSGEQVKLVPGVATALPRASGDGTSYSLTLRRGLRYSNGRQVKASDVGHAIRRSRRLSPEARRLFQGVRRVEATDRTGRVRIVLRRPQPDLPYALASTFAAPVPRDTPLRDMTGRPPPGVGPYAFVKSTPGRDFVLRRKRRFGLPGLPRGYLTEIVARRGGTAEDVIDGRLDYVQGRPPRDLLPELRSTYRDRYTERVTPSTRYLELAAGRAPLDREEVREAIVTAVDKRELAVLADGLLEPTCNLLPPAVAGYERLDPCPSDSPGEEPDLVKARGLVQDARAERTPISVTAPARERRLALAVVRTLRKIGLRARLARHGGQIRLAELGPAVPTARAYLVPVAEASEADPGLGPFAGELAVEPDANRSADLAADLERQLAEGSASVPYGYEKHAILLSERMDAQNCSAYNPIYGPDWASFCLR
jgi:peptide/nickel transport system substrate-binding protein